MEKKCLSDDLTVTVFDRLSLVIDNLGTIDF